jgi:hypothetical protein
MERTVPFSTTSAAEDGLMNFNWCTVSYALSGSIHHHRRASGANDGGGARTRSRTDYRSNSNGDSSADSAPRSRSGKGRNRRVRLIYQSNRQPSLFEARKRRTQGLTEIGEEFFS